MAARAPATPDLVDVIVAPGHTVDDGARNHPPGAPLRMPAAQAEPLLQAGAVVPACEAGGDAGGEDGEPAGEG